MYYLIVAQVTGMHGIKSKNNLRGIILGRRPIWGALSYLNNLLLQSKVQSAISLQFFMSKFDHCSDIILTSFQTLKVLIFENVFLFSQFIF